MNVRKMLQVTVAALALALPSASFAVNCTATTDIGSAHCKQQGTYGANNNCIKTDKKLFTCTPTWNAGYSTYNDFYCPAGWNWSYNGNC
jgi:hypothetical protein